MMMTATLGRARSGAVRALEALLDRVLEPAELEVLPCRGCGVGVRDPDPERVEMLHLYSAGNPGGVLVTRCARCADRHELAAELLREHPAVRRRLGDVGTDKLDATLSVVELAGQEPRRFAGSLLTSDKRLWEAIDGLFDVGVAVSWADRRPTAAPQAKRWAHASRETIADARRATREFTHYAFETPAPWAPPAGPGVIAGCLYCGVGYLVTRERDAARAWGDARSVRVGSVGGRDRPDAVQGFMCPECRFYVDKFGFGEESLFAAVLWHVDRLKRRDGWRPQLGVRAFAALPAGTPVNNEPWGHLDVAKLRQQFADLERRNIVRHLIQGESR